MARVPAARTTPRRLLAPGTAMAGAALAFTSMYLAAGALTPLLVTYQQQWHFPPAMLGVAFAVYALGFLLAALTLGSLSDHLGRRPVLVGALAVQLLSNALFLMATDVSWIVAGRLVQGVACGAATSAFTAVMVELAPQGRKRLGSILGSICLTGGLAVGSLLAGAAVQFSGAANSIVFTILIGLTIVGGVAMIASPETVQRSKIGLRVLMPRVSVPAIARREFAACAPVVAAVWMLAGLSGGVAPNMVRRVFHLDSGLLNGLAGGVAPAVSTVIGVVFARVRPSSAMTIGIQASIVGGASIAGGALLESLTVMMIGQAIAGIGFGACFAAALQLLIPRVAPEQRAGVVAALYVVAYLAFGLPIIIEGQLVERLGEIPAVVLYTVCTMVLAVLSLVARARLARRT